VFFAAPRREAPLFARLSLTAPNLLPASHQSSGEGNGRRAALKNSSQNRAAGRGAYKVVALQKRTARYWCS